MRAVPVLAVAFTAGAALFAAGITPKSDPLLVVELIAGAMAGGWAIAVGRNLLRTRGLAHHLDALSEARVIEE